MVGCQCGKSGVSVSVFAFRFCQPSLYCSRLKSMFQALDLQRGHLSGYLVCFLDLSAIRDDHAWSQFSHVYSSIGIILMLIIKLTPPNSLRREKPGLGMAQLQAQQQTYKLKTYPQFGGFCPSLHQEWYHSGDDLSSYSWYAN